MRFDRLLLAVLLSALLGSAAAAALVSHGVFVDQPSSVLRRWKPQEMARDDEDKSVFLPASIRRYTNALVRLTHPSAFVVAQFDDNNDAAFNAFVITNLNNTTCLLQACLWAPEEARRVKCMVQLVDFIEAAMCKCVASVADLDSEDLEDWTWAKGRDGWGI